MFKDSGVFGVQFEIFLDWILVVLVTIDKPIDVTPYLYQDKPIGVIPYLYQDSSGLYSSHVYITILVF